MPPYDQFVNGSYAVSSPVTDQERTVNWMVELSESQGATSKATLLPVPGFALYNRVTQVGGRAMFSMGTGGTAISGRVFGVSGSKLFEHFADGTNIDRTGAVGSLSVDGNPATISTNGDGGNQLFITSGTNGYNYNLLTNTLTQIASLNGAATQGGELYGYFVAFDATLNQIRISALFDGTTWDPLQFLARSIGSDPWTAMLVTPYGQILLPGSQTGEFLYNAGTSPFPFAPDPSGLIEEGIAATFSIKQAGKSSCWLSTNKNGGYQVQRAQGYSPIRISDHGIEDKIASYSRVDDAIGETYEDRGHAFYLLTFPTAKATWCYDFTTNKWHERMTWIAETNSEDAMRPTFHCFAFNKHLMADRTSSGIYEMNASFGTDIDGRPMRRIRRAPAVLNQQNRLFFPLLRILFQSGVGLQDGQGSNPIVMMRKSNDFGRTWSTERQGSIGAVGQYSKKVDFWNTGSGRGRVFEVTFTDPVPPRITAAFLPGLIDSTEAA